MESIKNLLETELSTLLAPTDDKPKPHVNLETPPDRNQGDYAFPCFRLAKTLGQKPQDLAQNLAKALGESAGVQKTALVTAVGPYVNFTIHKNVLATQILEPLFNPKAHSPKNFTWVIEYSSPNVAKPFQIYHLRTTIVGSTLAKIARRQGYNVISINHLGDWGTQYGKLAIAFEKYGDEIPANPTLHDLVRIYVQIHKDMETDPTIEPRGREAFKKLEQGDPELRSLWKKCVDISLKSFNELYARYAVNFDHIWGESFYETHLQKTLEQVERSGVLVRDDGADIVRVTDRAGHEIPPCILRKSDGASIYATRDLAAALYRYQKFGFDRMTYVVGKEQKLVFEQLFGVLRAMKVDFEPKCEHLATGLYRFKDAKMSTRKGNFVTLDEVHQLCKERALELMRGRESSQGLAPDELDAIAEKVAIAALVFADLSTDPTKDLDFDVERVVSFEGETGPYLQYAHTRCLSILRKSELQPETNSERIAAQIMQQPEIDLLRRLGRFNEACDRALDQRKPTQLTTYLIDLASDFGLFYRECKVRLPDQPDLERARLALVKATQITLNEGLALLGIPLPEKM